MKQVFVSYVYEDKKYRDKLESWAHQGKLGEVKITGEGKDVRQYGHAAIRREISPRLRGASTLLVLVGQDSHNHDWVDYEVDHAQSAHKQILVVRIPETTGLAPRSVRWALERAFDPTAIRQALGT